MLPSTAVSLPAVSYAKLFSSKVKIEDAVIYLIGKGNSKIYLYSRMIGVINVPKQFK